MHFWEPRDMSAETSQVHCFPSPSIHNTATPCIPFPSCPGMWHLPSCAAVHMEGVSSHAGSAFPGEWAVLCSKNLPLGASRVTKALSIAGTFPCRVQTHRHWATVLGVTHTLLSPGIFIPMTATILIQWEFIILGSIMLVLCKSLQAALSISPDTNYKSERKIHSFTLQHSVYYCSALSRMATARSHPKPGFRQRSCSGAQWNMSALEAWERRHVHSPEEQCAKAKLPQLTYLRPQTPPGYATRGHRNDSSINKCQCLSWLLKHDSTCRNKM